MSPTKKSAKPRKTKRTKLGELRANIEARTATQARGVQSRSIEMWDKGGKTIDLTKPRRPSIRYTPPPVVFNGTYPRADKSRKGR